MTKERKRQKRHLVGAELPTLEELSKSQNEVIDKHGQAETTKRTYASYLKNGRNFLANLVKSVDKKDMDSDFDAAQFDSDGPETIGQLLKDPQFAAALEGKPNIHSPRALVLFLQKSVSTRRRDCLQLRVSEQHSGNIGKNCAFN